jgi:hypothetical protein
MPREEQLESFQVVLFVGWLRTRPRTTWSVSRPSVRNPAALAASQIRISAWWADVAGTTWFVA